ncbi:MAG: hypothetical protein IJY46_07895 [Lentisphaeria bacterium]|nr:hypothetical protein [Lentisphaeria bacterium]
MRKLSLILLSTALTLQLTAAPRTDAEAAKLLKTYAEKGKNRKSFSGRTAFFARGQLKYGLERYDYLHRWVDRPLFQDSSFIDASTGHFLNNAAWKVMHRVVKDMYQLDGFSFFPITKQRDDLYRAAATPDYQMNVLPEYVSPAAIIKYGGTPDWAKTYQLTEQALNSKQTFRINGKIVITSYPADTDPAYWVELKKRLTARYGDKFIIAPMHMLPRNIVASGKPLTVRDVNTLANIIRKWLRSVDGYYYNFPPLNEYRRYDDDFDKNVMIPLLTGILAEDEFKDKILAWGTKVGHENFYAKGTFTYNCGGTSMLRGSVGSAVAAKADVVNLVEWDEQNENTSFRPTLYNSFSTQRIMRYLSGVAKGKLFSRLPGDDASVPNLILSYRKIVVAGETVEFEIVNVPEAESTGKELNITLTVKDHRGNTVKTFSGKAKDNRLAELRFNVKAADVISHHILIPELTVNGKKFASGFTPVELRANWNADNKWVKQPLRDLASCSAELKIAGRTADGFIKLQGKVRSAVPLHSVEVIDSGDHIYQHQKNNPFLETEDRAVFSIMVEGYDRKKIRFTGDIKVCDAPSARCRTQRTGGEAPRSKLDHELIATTTNSGWHFVGKKAIYGSYNACMFQLSVAKRDLAKGYLDISVDAVIPRGARTTIFKGKLPLAELAKKRVFATNSLLGTTLTIRRTDIQHIIPESLDQKTADFTILVNPHLPQSVYFIEIVDKNRKTFRSLPVTVFRPSGKKVKFSSFDFFDKHPITVICDSNMLTPQILDFSATHGTAIKNSGGNILTGMRGGNSSRVNNLYLAEDYKHGNFAMKHMSKNTPDNVKSFPELETRSDGKNVWRFNGKCNASLPVASIYPYCGFELKLNFTAADVNTKQILVTNSDQAFNLFINKGRLFASFYSMGGNVAKQPFLVAGPMIAPGVENQVTLRFNQKHVQIFCNGKKGKAKPLAGYLLYPAETSIGHGLRNLGFIGTISKFELRPL